MALVNIESALRKILNTLKKTPVGAGLEVLSYKRNRGITVIKKDGDIFLVRERGYLDQELECTGRELQKQLKSMMKREFPRSRKVRVYVLKDESEAETARKKL